MDTENTSLKSQNNRWRNWRVKNPRRTLWYHAKRRAKAKNLPFNLTKEDIIIPKNCPVLGISLQAATRNSQGSGPSIDRIVPELGYVKGNIIIMSHLANSIKYNAHWWRIFLVAWFCFKLDMKIKIKAAMNGHVESSLVAKSTT